jgi:hypothetical protein
VIGSTIDVVETFKFEFGFSSRGIQEAFEVISHSARLTNLASDRSWRRIDGYRSRFLGGHRDKQTCGDESESARRDRLDNCLAHWRSPWNVERFDRDDQRLPLPLPNDGGNAFLKMPWVCVSR